MTAPSESFTVVPDSDVDKSSPLDEDLLGALRSNLIHLREWLGNGYTPTENHDHDDYNSAGIVGPASPNFILNSNLAGTSSGWTLSSVSLVSNYGFRFDTSAANRSADQSMAGDSANVGMFGTTGNDWVCSIFARTVTGTATSGIMEFGLSDNNTEFMTGTTAVIGFATHNLTTTWKRFYSFMTPSVTGRNGDGSATDLRFVVRVTSGNEANQQIYVNGFMVNIGTWLNAFHTCPLDSIHSNSNWSNWGNQCPVWDTTIAIDNAVEITAS